MIKSFGKSFLAVLFATIATSLITPQAQARTYIVNGLASAVPFIGYGMNNLGKKYQVQKSLVILLRLKAIGLSNQIF